MWRSNPFPVVLSELADARWDEYRVAAQEAKIQAPCAPELVRYLKRTLALSDFITLSLRREPALLPDLLHNGELLTTTHDRDYQLYTRRAAAAARDEAGLATALRHLRRREMTRIAIRDLAGWTPLAETLHELSEFASAIVAAAYARLHAWHAPRRMPYLLVVALGKLGGDELNFSSDIDLVYIRPQHRDPRRMTAHNEECYLALAQRLTHALATHDAEGFLYRVDLRLRPFGDDGPLVINLSALEDYFITHGRDWERYAWIKARVLNADALGGAALEAVVRPFVYRRYLDNSAFQALRDMKALIMRELAQHGGEDDIKRGAGGIREIEFIAQAFQLARGGRHAELRQRGLRATLDALAAAQLLPQTTVHALHTAYDFLRRLENRLQALRDEQTHRLPEAALDRARLAYGMGCTDWDALTETLTAHRARVQDHFKRLFGDTAPKHRAERVPPDPELSTLEQDGLSAAAAQALFTRLGYAEPAEAARRVLSLRGSTAFLALSLRGRALMGRLLPQAVVESTRTEHPDACLARLLILLEAIMRRTAYLALLDEYPSALTHLARLCASSPWIARLLARHPILLDELLDVRRLYAPQDAATLGVELQGLLAAGNALDAEHVMEALRAFKQAQVLRVAAADIAGTLPVPRVSDRLTDIAKVALEAVLAAAWSHLTARHGMPRCGTGKARRRVGFAVIGYGKLGGLELGYGSDLDLVFLHDSTESNAHSDGRVPLSNEVFFARLAQRIIHFLNTPTPSGVLYEVDTRLRPSGGSGVLVTSLAAYAEYQRNAAWIWEHQALVRARSAAGDAGLATCFSTLRAEILRQPRDPARLTAEVAAMRARMAQELSRGDTAPFDLKQDRGGIVDIEFLVQYAVLRWAHEHPALALYTDNLRILETLSQVGLVTVGTAHALTAAYLTLRAQIHRLALQEQPARVPTAEYTAERDTVRALWSRWLG